MGGIRRTGLLVAALVLCIAGGLAGPSAARAERTLALSSGSFSFEVDPGEQGTGEVVVINDGDEPVNVLVYTADQEIDEVGDVTYLVPNRSDPEFARRPTAWVRLQMPAEARSFGNTPYLELEPGERIPVSFEFQPPLNASPGDHNVVLFFEMFEFSGEAGGATSEVTGRIGSRLQMRVRGDYVERLSVQPFIVPGLHIGSDVPYELTISNSGNLDQRVSAAVVLFDRNRVEIGRDEPLLATTVFADTSRRLEGVVSGGRPLFGRFVMQAEVYNVNEDGEILAAREPIVEVRDVWLVPEWVLVVLVALFVIFAVRVLWSRRSGRREPARQADDASDDEVGSGREA